jgi:hypothetical protein
MHPRFLQEPRRWTEAEIEFVKARVGKMEHVDIARQLGRTHQAVKAFALRCGFLTRSRLTEKEKEEIKRRLRAGETLVSIAAASKRSMQPILKIKNELGLVRRLVPMDGEFMDFIRQGNRLGWTDIEITCAYQKLFPGYAIIDRHTTSKYRRQMELPDNRTSPHMIARVRENTRRQCAAAGVLHLGELRAVVLRSRVEKSGWPKDLLFRQVQILDALYERGPMTREEICAAIGMRWKGPKTEMIANGRGTTYLSDLMRRGLVTSLGRKFNTGGKGKNTCIYSVPIWIERSAS